MLSSIRTAAQWEFRPNFRVRLFLDACADAVPGEPLARDDQCLFRCRLRFKQKFTNDFQLVAP